MATFSSLAEEVLGHLRAYTSDQDRKTYLTTSINATDTTFLAANAEYLSEGLAEIEDELVEIATVDTTSGTATLFPWGRGAGGSTAVAHGPNVRVSIAPRWPRGQVKNKINETVLSLWPDLFVVVSDTSLITSSTSLTYTLPADCRRVLDVKYEVPGPEDYWQGVRTWRVDNAADTTQHPTGVAIDIPEWMYGGRSLKVTYAREPTPMVNDADDFVTTTGLPVSCVDLVTLGAASKLVISADLARTQMFNIEHNDQNQTQPAGAASNASKYLMQLYQVRLQQERDKLYDRYPMQQRRVWA